MTEDEVRLLLCRACEDDQTLEYALEPLMSSLSALPMDMALALDRLLSQWEQGLLEQGLRVEAEPVRLALPDVPGFSQGLAAIK